MMLLYLSVVMLLSRYSAAASCGTTLITSQSDANTLATACPNITGDVILSPNISEPINLSGLQNIEGSFLGGPCDMSCTSFTSLNISTLISVTGNLSLDGINNIASINIPQLRTVGGPLIFNNLPSLQKLSLQNLASVGQFQITSAPNLSCLDLEQLQNVTGSSPSVEVTNVSLTYASGISPHTNLSSFIFRDIPNLQHYILTTPHVEYLELLTSTNFVPLYPYDTGITISVSSGGTFNISGSNNVQFIGTDLQNFIVSNNWFEIILIDFLKIHNNLTITDNSNLVTVSFPQDMSMLQNLQVTNNTKYTGTRFGGWNWPWNMRNCTSMYFQGGILNDMFKEFVNFSLVEVTNEFVLNSTDPTFDCGFLNTLRSQGYFQGTYGCQNKTLKAGAVRTTADVKSFISKASVLSIPMLASFVGLFLALVGFL